MQNKIASILSRSV